MLWKAQLSEKKLFHFPASRSLVEEGTAFSGEKYVAAIEKLQQEFDQRFADFKTHSATFQMFADPFSFDVQNVLSVLQMELTDLQCNSELKAKFREANHQFLRTTPILPRAVQEDHVPFRSTYLICEKTILHHEL